LRPDRAVRQRERHAMKLASDPRDWQPFTFRGVAALATGSPRRLLKVQLLCALWVAGSLGWFLGTAWWPVIDDAAERLPDRAVIQHRTLVWDGPLPVRLGENAYLSITVDLDGNPARTSTSDLQLELVRDGARFHSLFGHVTVPYPRGYRVMLDRMEFRAWWGAWRWPLLIVIGGTAFLALLAAWYLVAATYAAWVRFFSFFADRLGTPSVCWRLAAAAQAPSAVLMGAAVFLYGLHRLSLVGLLFAIVVQLVVGWVYLVLSPFWLPRRPGTATRSFNPFRR
jgi:hypothetical protein